MRRYRCSGTCADEFELLSTEEKLCPVCKKAALRVFDTTGAPGVSSGSVRRAERMLTSALKPTGAGDWSAEKGPHSHLEQPRERQSEVMGVDQRGAYIGRHRITQASQIASLGSGVSLLREMPNFTDYARRQANTALSRSFSYGNFKGEGL